MKLKSLIILIFAAFAVLMFGCKRQPRSVHHTHKHNTKTVHAYHLDDGRVAYRGDDGFWYYYMYMMTNDPLPRYYTAPSSSFALPRGGAWVPAKGMPPEKAEELEKEVTEKPVIDEKVEVNENNEPLSIQEVHEEQLEFNFDENHSETETSNENTTESSNGNSSSNDSDSTDSGPSTSDSGSSDSGGGSGE